MNDAVPQPGARPAEMPPAQQPWALLDLLAGLSWRFLLCVAAVSVVVFALVQLSFVVVPLLIAILVSSILAPLSTYLRGRGWSAGKAATATVGFVVLVILILGIIVVPPVISTLDDLVSALKDGTIELDKVLTDSPFNIDPTQADAIVANLQEAAPKIEDTLMSGIGTLVPFIGQAIATFLLALVMTGYMLLDGDRHWKWMLGFVEESRRPAMDDLGRSAYGTLSAYLRGTSIVALFNTAGITFGAWLLGMPLLVPLAIIIFFAAFLPIIGAWLAAGTAMLIALASGGVGTAIGIGLTYLFVSQFKSYFISPFVVGSAVKLPPIITLTSVMVGTVLGGIAGGILAVPLVATVSGALGQVRKWRIDGGIPIDPPPAETPGVSA